MGCYISYSKERDHCSPKQAHVIATYQGLANECRTIRYTAQTCETFYKFIWQNYLLLTKQKLVFKAWRFLQKGQTKVRRSIGKRPKLPTDQNGPDQNGPQILDMTKTLSLAFEAWLLLILWRTLNRKEQLGHRAVSLRQHGFLVDLAMRLNEQF